VPSALEVPSKVDKGKFIVRRRTLFEEVRRGAPPPGALGRSSCHPAHIPEGGECRVKAVESRGGRVSAPFPAVCTWENSSPLDPSGVAHRPGSADTSAKGHGPRRG